MATSSRVEPEPLEIEDIHGRGARSQPEEIEMQTKPTDVGLTSWYDKFMVFKPLGPDMFDNQVLKLV